MQILIVLAHPRKGSFNHAIADEAAGTARANGHRVTLRDLYAEGFDPVLPDEEIPKKAGLAPSLATSCREAAAADGFVIVHPNWWGQPPAILKGWIDRVLRPGVAYEFREGDSGEGVPVGLLKARAALVFNTSNTAAERERDVFGDPLERIWKDCIFGLCGVKTVHRATFGVIVTSTPQRRDAWLADVRAAVNRYFPPS